MPCSLEKWEDRSKVYERLRKGDEKRSEHPVEGVTWYEAVSFCRWSSTLPGFEDVRLPTEAGREAGITVDPAEEPADLAEPPAGVPPPRHPGS